MHLENFHCKPLRSLRLLSHAGITTSALTLQWNSKMKDLSRRGSLEDLVHLYSNAAKQGLKPDAALAFPFLLKAIAALSRLDMGTIVHAQIVKHGFQDDLIVQTSLVDMYSKCTNLLHARKVFDEMPQRDTAACNAMLSGYSRNGYVAEGLSFFSWMCFSGEKPNSLTISVLLQVSGDIRAPVLGRCLHCYVYRRGMGFESDVFLCNSLLVFYNKCGDLENSKRVFCTMSKRELVSWNTMIAGYFQNGFSFGALEMFRQLQKEGFSPDLVTLDTALQACARTGDIVLGRSIHGFLVRSRFCLNVYIENSILLMYCKCGYLVCAHNLFEKMPLRNLVSWNILINGYFQMGLHQRTLILFNHLRSVETEVSSDLLVIALGAVKRLGILEQGMCIHGLAILTGYDSDVFVGSSLIAMYGEYGSTWISHRCFDCLYERNIVSWNSLLSVFVQNGCFDEAIEFVHCMQFEGCEFDAVTLVNTLHACAQTANLRLGKIIHGYSIRSWLDHSNIILAAALLDMYVKCGLLGVACLLFRKMPRRNIVSWNTIVFGCCRNGFHRESLIFFHIMQQEGVIPDVTTLVGVIRACSQQGYEREGRYLHRYTIRAGFHQDEFVANSLISMYAEFGDFESAKSVFDRLSNRTKATWNAMIAMYSHFRFWGEAISLFQLMKVENVVPDSITLLSIIPACSHLASLRYGSWIHTFICKTGFDANVFVGTALIDMYAKCGDISMSRLVFEKMNVKNEITWNSMILGHGIHGNAEEAHNLFVEMLKSGLDPTAVTFLVLITTCSHTGDIKRGQQYLGLMIRTYSISPTVEHYSSFVDLLSRGGLLHKAHGLIERMPVAPGACAWGSLLAACRIHGDMEMGMLAAEKLFQLNPLHCGYHVVLANVQADSGRWSDASNTRMKLREMGVNKLPGWSMVEQMPYS